MTSIEFVLYASGAVAFLLLSYFLYRFTFDVGIRTRHIKAQTQLLGRIAEKQGVGKDEVETIIRNAENP